MNSPSRLWLPENKITLHNKILKVNVLQDFLKISNIGNDLEKIAVKIVPEINLILNSFKESNSCLKFGMSGSGPTCYGIFENRKKKTFSKNLRIS